MMNKNMSTNNNAFGSVFFIVLMTMITSCGGNSKSQQQDADSLDVDSLPEKVVVKSLPDSSLASADKLDYRIDVFDTVHSGKLVDLSDCYADVPGVFTFRGNPYRNADFGGRVEGRPDTITVDWAFTTDYDGTSTSVGTWGGGTGWTGQPLYVEWPDSCIKNFEQYAKHEIILGSLASRVYFIDFETGKASRPSIGVNNPIKGTLMLDPRMNGKVYVGHGVPARNPFGMMTIDLKLHDVTYTFPKDPNAWRGWGAFDSSPVRVDDYVFRPGENGTLYKYYVNGDEEILHSTLRFRMKGGWGAAGVEASMAVYANYGYLADNHGAVVCVNLETLRPIWYYDNVDDNDATPVIEVVDDVPYVYCSCEVDKQGSGDARLAKVNGLTGEEVWCFKAKARQVHIGDKHFDGGFYGTPLLGNGKCGDRIFANIVYNTGGGQDGALIALDRKTGEQIFSTKLKHYAWSSPVGFLNEKDEMFIVTGDTFGNIYLIDGQSGEIICRSSVGSNFESSPVVVGNHIVVGSRGDKIYKMTIK